MGDGPLLHEENDFLPERKTSCSSCACSTYANELAKVEANTLCYCYKGYKKMNSCYSYDVNFFKPPFGQKVFGA